MIFAYDGINYGGDPYRGFLFHVYYSIAVVSHSRLARIDNDNLTVVIGIMQERSRRLDVQTCSHNDKQVGL